MVHWEGYSDTEDSWVLERDIDGELVRAYLEQLDGEMGDNKAHKVDTQTTTPSPKVREGGVRGREPNSQIGNQ